jgi:hypothetical protein
MGWRAHAQAGGDARRGGAASLPWPQTEGRSVSGADIYDDFLKESPDCVLVSFGGHADSDSTACFVLHKGTWADCAGVGGLPSGKRIRWHRDCLQSRHHARSRLEDLKAVTNGLIGG